MYSPRIAERLIPPLYRLARSRRQPMTRLASEAVERYLAEHGALVEPTPLRPAGAPARRERRAA